MMDFCGYLLEKALEVLQSQDQNFDIEVVLTGDEQKNKATEPTETRVVGVRQLENKIILIVAKF